MEQQVISGLVSSLFERQTRLDRVIDIWRIVAKGQNIKEHILNFFELVNCNVDVSIQEDCLCLFADKRSGINVGNLNKQESILFLHLIKGVYFKTKTQTKLNLWDPEQPLCKDFIYNQFLETILPRHIVCARFIARLIYENRTSTNLVKIIDLIRITIDDYRHKSLFHLQVTELAANVVIDGLIPIVNDTWNPFISILPIKY